MIVNVAVTCASLVDPVAILNDCSGVEGHRSGGVSQQRLRDTASHNAHGHRGGRGGEVLRQTAKSVRLGARCRRTGVEVSATQSLSPISPKDRK